MKNRHNFLQRIAALALIPAMLMLGACSKTETLDPKGFVGEWKSSRAPDNPISIYDNHEWEVKALDGKVIQYGVWQIVGDRNIMWSHREAGGNAFHEVNPVISVTPYEFKVQELDRTTTTFVRIG